jgi:hypothetical protein
VIAGLQRGPRSWLSSLDMPMACSPKTYDRVRQMMKTDWLPTRIELAPPGAGGVDVHPVSSRSRERTHLTTGTGCCATAEIISFCRFAATIVIFVRSTAS